MTVIEYPKVLEALSKIVAFVTDGESVRKYRCLIQIQQTSK